MSIRPLRDNILVRRHGAEDRSKGGIYIPSNAQDKMFRGTVEAVGEGRVLDDGKVLAPTVCRGDVVLFGRYSETAVAPDSDELILIPESSILAVIEAK